MRFLILQQVMQGRYYETAKKCLWCSWISKVWPQDHQCNRQRPWLPTPLVGPTTSNRKHDLSHPHHYQSLQRENDVFATGTNIRENKRPEVKRAIEYYPCAHLELMKQKKILIKIPAALGFGVRKFRIRGHDPQMFSSDLLDSAQQHKKWDTAIHRMIS